MSRTIFVGITHGDYNGIGYEIVLKALAEEKVTELFTPVFFASPRLVEKARKDMGIELPPYEVIKDASEAKEGRINIVDLNIAETPLAPGEPTRESGRAAVKALDVAVEALKAGSIQVLVTAPISKIAVQSEDFQYPGHTEYLSAKIGDESSQPQMILYDDYLRVALVTTHLPISKIPETITEEKVYGSIKSFDKALRGDFGCERPKIAVLSLNPHCGDAGLLGTEEETAIKPAIEKAVDEGLLIFGPYSADGFFATGSYSHYDGVLAMYHDQGLAPFKALAEERGVNFTSGLQYIRTSPDHGTAYDKAWKGKADPTSMREAIYKAIDLYRNRERYRKMSANPLRKAKIEKVSDKTVDLTKETL